MGEVADEDPCPECGRVSHDWSKRFDSERDEKGHKGVFNKEDSFKEDRNAPYRRWRYTLGKGIWAMDIDQVEWRRDRNGEPYPVATIELTRVDRDDEKPDAYFQKILDRFGERDYQAQHVKHVAAALGVHCYIVAFRHDLTEFWVYNLSAGRGWRHWGPEQYAGFLRKLKLPEAA